MIMGSQLEHDSGSRVLVETETSASKRFGKQHSHGRRMQVDDGTDILGSGNISYENRVINFSIRRITGGCFSISLFVLSTQQQWIVFVPANESLAAVFENKRSMSQSIQDSLGIWLLSCTKLKFDGDVIVAAHFDNENFCKLYERETSRLGYRSTEGNSSGKANYSNNRYQTSNNEQRAVKKATALNNRYTDLAGSSEVSHLYNEMLAAGAAAYGEEWNSASSLDSDGLRHLEREFGYSSTEDLRSPRRPNSNKKFVTQTVIPTQLGAPDSTYSSDDDDKLSYFHRGRSLKSKTTKSPRPTGNKTGSILSGKKVQNKAGFYHRQEPFDARSSSSPGRLRKPAPPSDQNRQMRKRHSPSPDMRRFGSSQQLSTAELSSLKSEVEDVLGQFKHDLDTMRVELRTATARSRSNSPEARVVYNVTTSPRPGNKQNFRKSQLVPSRMDGMKFSSKAAEAAYYRSRYDLAVSEIAQMEILLSAKAAKKSSPFKQAKFKEMELAVKNAEAELQLQRTKMEIEMEEKIRDTRQQVTNEMQAVIVAREEMVRQQTIAEMETMMRIRNGPNGPPPSAGRGGRGGRGPPPNGGRGGRMGPNGMEYPPSLSRAGSASQRFVQRDGPSGAPEQNPNRSPHVSPQPSTRMRGSSGEDFQDPALIGQQSTGYRSRGSFVQIGTGQGISPPASTRDIKLPDIIEIRGKSSTDSLHSEVSRLTEPSVFGQGSEYHASGPESTKILALRLTCKNPNALIRIRPSPSVNEAEIGFAQIGSVYFVHESPVSGFYKLVHEPGYIVAQAPGVVWEPVVQDKVPETTAITTTRESEPLASITVASSKLPEPIVNKTFSSIPANIVSGSNDPPAPASFEPAATLPTRIETHVSVPQVAAPIIAPQVAATISALHVTAPVSAPQIAVSAVAPAPASMDSTAVPAQAPTPIPTSVGAIGAEATAPAATSVPSSEDSIISIRMTSKNPKARMRIRPTASVDFKEIGFIDVGKVHRVYKTKENGYFKFVDMDGYVMSDAPGVEWELVSETSKSSGNIVGNIASLFGNSKGKEKDKTGPTHRETGKKAPSPLLGKSKTSPEKHEVGGPRKPNAPTPSSTTPSRGRNLAEPTPGIVPSVETAPSTTPLRGQNLAEPTPGTVPSVETESSAIEISSTVEPKPSISNHEPDFALKSPTQVEASIASMFVHEDPEKVSQKRLEEETARVDLKRKDAMNKLSHFFQGVVARRRFGKMKGQDSFVVTVALKMLSNEDVNLGTLNRAWKIGVATSSPAVLSAAIAKSSSLVADNKTAEVLDAFDCVALSKAIHSCSENLELTVPMVDLLNALVKTETSDTPTPATEAADRFISRLGNSDACDRIVMLLEKFIKKSSLIYKIIRVLTRLTISNVDNSTRVAKDSNVAIIAKVCEKYIKSIQIFESVCRLSLTCCHGNAQNMANMAYGLSDLIFRAVEINIEVEKFIFISCKTLIGFSTSHSPNQLLLASNSRLPIIVRLLSIYKDNSTALEGICWCLLSICADNIGACDFLQKTDFLEQAYAMMSDQGLRPEVHLFLLWLVSTIAYEDPTREELYAKFGVLLDKTMSNKDCNDAIRNQAVIAKNRMGRPKSLSASVSLMSSRSLRSASVRK